MNIGNHFRLLMLNTVSYMLVVFVLGGSNSLASDKQQQEIYPKDLSEWLQLEFPSCENYNLHTAEQNPENVTYETEYMPFYSGVLSTNSWEVYSENGNVYARPYDVNAGISQLVIPDCLSIWYPKFPIKKVQDGWIVGAMESPEMIGGLLLWYSNDCEEQYLISCDRIIRFIQYNNKLYALAGHSQYNLSGGKILIIHKVDGRWEADRYMRIKTAPLAAKIFEEGEILVVTTNELIRVHNDELKVIYQNDCWEPFLPNSVALDSDNNVYIGMNQGIAKIISGNKGMEIIWLVPNAKYLQDDVENVKRIHNIGNNRSDLSIMDSLNNPLDKTVTTDRNKRIPLY